MSEPNERLRALRQGQGLSRHDLADITGLAESTIGRIEEGTSEYRTNRQVASILAGVFDVRVSEIFDPSDLSDLGRPPLSGRPIRTTITIEHQYENVCPRCRFVNGEVVRECEMCGGELRDG